MQIVTPNPTTDPISKALGEDARNLQFNQYTKEILMGYIV